MTIHKSIFWPGSNVGNIVVYENRARAQRSGARNRNRNRPRKSEKRARVRVRVRVSIRPSVTWYKPFLNQGDILPFVDLVMVHANIVQADAMPNSICEDPDDDMFLACALVSQTRIIISGDKHLLKLNGFEGIEILKPKSFLDRYLES